MKQAKNRNSNLKKLEISLKLRELHTYDEKNRKRRRGVRLENAKVNCRKLTMKKKETCRNLP